MNNIKSIYSISIILMSFCIFSCSSKPVEPNNYLSFDSARYIWEIDTMKGEIFRVHAYDTNNIFYLMLSGQVVKYSDTQYSNLNVTASNYNIYSMAVLNNHSLYIGGEYLINSPMLGQWNNGSVDYIDIPINRRFPITELFLDINNSLYIGSNRGDVIMYKDGQFNFYNTDTIYFNLDTPQNIFFFISQDNVISFLASKRENIGSSYIQYTDVYKLINNVWTKVFSETYNQNNLGEYNTFIMNKNLYAMKDMTIYLFSENSFMPVLNVNYLSNTKFYMGGKSKDDFLLFGGQNIYHWNGFKWSKEFVNNIVDVGVQCTKVNNLYVLTINDFMSNSYIFYGKPK